MRIKANRWRTTAVGALVVACGVALAMAQAGYTTISGRVIGRVFAWPAAVAPATGFHQQVALLRLNNGAV